MAAAAATCTVANEVPAPLPKLPEFEPTEPTLEPDEPGSSGSVGWAGTWPGSGNPSARGTSEAGAQTSIISAPWPYLNQSERSGLTPPTPMVRSYLAG